MALWEWKVKIAEARIKLAIELYKAKIARLEAKHGNFT